MGLLCEVLSVSRTAYYRYQRGKSTDTHQLQNRPKHEVRKEFLRNMKRYGSRRIKASLNAKGIAIGRKKVSKLMKEQGLKAIQPRKFVPRTTDSKHGQRVCENLLLNKEKPSAPNAVWTVRRAVSDITYLPLKNGHWAYLGAWIDLYTRQVVGWQVADNMREELIREPLENALLKRKTAPGMIVHSDRGGQYLSNNMKKLIKTFTLQQSMSRADDPYDNAYAESFWTGPPGGRLKAEIDIPKGGFENIGVLRNLLFDYIEGYYNRVRLHSALNYLTPLDFEAQYYKNAG